MATQQQQYPLITTEARHPHLMLLQSALFITIWLVLHVHVSRHGPIPGASALGRLHNRAYSVGSAALLAVILASVLQPSSHDPTGTLARKLYHASKFYEYLDLLLVRAAGGHIGAHFGFHHATTPWLTYVRVLPAQHSEGWCLFAALNAFHHVLMYAYFGGWGSIRPVLPWTGGFQLVAGMMGEAALVWALRGGDKALWPHAVAGGLVGSYFVLYLRDLRLKRV